MTDTFDALAVESSSGRHSQSGSAQSVIVLTVLRLRLAYQCRSPGTAWHRARAVSAPNAADLAALRAQSKPGAATVSNGVPPHEEAVSPAATEPDLAAISASADDATSKEASGMCQLTASANSSCLMYAATWLGLSLIS